MGDMKLVETIKQRITALPMLPQVAYRLMAIIDDDSHTIKDVVKLIENDVSLASSVLRVVNSAAFSPRQPISTLNRAVIHLGEKMVVGIALGACSAKLMGRPLEGYESAAGEMWDHSLRTAIASRRITDYAINEVSPDLAFTAGLLHDIGKLILSEFLKGNTRRIIDLFTRGKTGVESEKDLIGTDHAEVGFAIAKQPLCEVIKNHHHPYKAVRIHRDLTYMVHLGDIAAMLGGAGTGADTLAYKMDEYYQMYVNIRKDDFALFLFQVEEEFSITKDNILNS